MDINITKYALIMLGLLTFISRNARQWIKIDLKNVIFPPAIFSILLYLFEDLSNIKSQIPNSILISIVVNPIIEEIIFRQPLFFVRKSKFFWLLGLILGAIFVIMHDNSSVYEITARAIGTFLLLASFRRYGLVGSIITHSVLNIGSLIRGMLS